MPEELQEKMNLKKARFETEVIMGIELTGSMGGSCSFVTLALNGICRFCSRSWSAQIPKWDPCSIEM